VTRLRRLRFSDAVTKQLGVLPNLFRLVSPAALAGMTALNGALSRALNVKTRERIAIATAVNGCDYCLSIHVSRLNFAKLSADEVALNQKGASNDPKADAAVRFAAKVAHSRGNGHRRRRCRREARWLQRSPDHRNRRSWPNTFTNLINNVAQNRHRCPCVRAVEAA
jgi:AhpD family alkylhydroperoxidase